MWTRRCAGLLRQAIPSPLCRTGIAKHHCALGLLPAYASNGRSAITICTRATSSARYFSSQAADEERYSRQSASAVKWMIFGVGVVLTWKMIPQLGEGTIDSSVLLLKADTPIFVKSGCQRVGTLVTSSEKVAKAAVDREAIPLLLRVLTIMPQQDVICEAVRALHALSSTDAGWLALLVHKDEVVPHVQRFLQHPESTVRVEDRAMARELLHRCQGNTPDEPIL